jgi:hypothetical protein
VVFKVSVYCDVVPQFDASDLCHWGHQGQEGKVFIVTLTSTVIGLSRKCVWLTHPSTWLMVKHEVES